MSSMEMFLDLIDYYDLGALDSSLLKEKVQGLSASKIVSICDSLTQAVFNEKPKKESLGVFDFVVSNSLAANHGYSCSEAACRLTKVLNMESFPHFIQILYTCLIILEQSHI